MANGLLEVDGSLSLDQFWPTGGSDADTTKIIVNVGNNPFRFRPHADAPLKVTHALDGAKVRSANGTMDVVKNGALTVRLQGIDAPELHYTPSAEKKKADQTPTQRELYLKWNLKFRQNLAETATVALCDFLQSAGGNAMTIPCKVCTAVDSPGEVFDVYGRFVGNLVVDGDRDVNLWLAEQGWVFPAYYNSMSNEEIEGLTARATDAYNAWRGVWPYLVNSISNSSFDWDVVYRGKNVEIDEAADQGSVILPKLFRRLSAYMLNRRAQMVSGSFEKYLRSKRSSDTVHLTEEFLSQGATAAPVRFLDEFLTSGAFTVWPEDIVFREKPSKLIGPDGGEPSF